MTEKCAADQTMFEPFEVCQASCKETWINALNAVATNKDDAAPAIHYEDTEISTALKDDASPTERLCEAVRVNSDSGELMGIVRAAFKCVRDVN